MNEKCHVCGSTKITHYRQIRVDGVAVVTARCANWHIPIKGKPFYPVAQFDLKKLPLLPDEQPLFQYVEAFKEQTQEVQKKYPSMPRPKSTGVNFPYPVEDK